jgi:predicted nucleotide-binding protein
MDKTKQAGKPQKAGGLRRRKSVLVIHGHDELNLYRLKEFLLGLRLDLVLLNELPGRSNTIIEKWELQAPDADYAIALMTPDDHVESEKKNYLQARPNVHIEIGWAFCFLGRANVCLLVMRGTHIPTDLEGIHRVEFDTSIKEVAPQLEKELKSAGISMRRRLQPTSPRISH